jgi:hypothetical protein
MKLQFTSNFLKLLSLTTEIKQESYIIKKISIPKLKTLRFLHSGPINVIIFHGFKKFF